MTDHRVAPTEAAIRLYSEVVRRMGLGMLVWHLVDPDDVRTWRLVAANPAALALLGAAEAEVLHRSLPESLPQLLATGLPHGLRAVLRDCGERELGLVPYGGREGRRARAVAFALPEGCVGLLLEDVTEQQRAQAVRATYEELGRRLGAAHTPEAAGRSIAAAAQELLGWDACTLDLYFAESDTVQAVLSIDRVGGELRDVPHGWTAAEPGPMTRRVLAHGAQLILREGPGDHTGERELVPFGDEARRSASLMFVPIRHADRISGILSIQSYTPRAYDQADLATLEALAEHCGGALERLRIEHELRESQTQLARTEAFSLVIVAHVDLDGRWRKVPPTLCELLGYAAGELLALRVADVTHPDDIGPEADECARLVRGETRSFDLEKRYLRRDGRVVWAYVNCSIVQDAGSRPLYFLTYIRDITERKHLEERLRQAQKMEAVGQLAGGIAHDFNNLLTAIQGYVQLLLIEMAPQDPRRADVAEIARATERAAGLTRQLLAFSRKQVLQPKLLDLNQVVMELSGMLGRLLGEGIHLRLELVPGVGAVFADPNQLEQVIVNLAVNARDAMPHGGTLTISTGSAAAEDLPPEANEAPLQGPLVLLRVSDTGIGMDEATQARLFEPFFTTKGVGRGTGLGLATVYGIVKQSGGRILVDTRPHEGTTFTICLPRVEGATPTAAASTVPAAPGGTETVLVAEDEDAVRILTARALRLKGYRVLEASSGSDALALAERLGGPIDLLVTDVVMPGMSGIELAQRLCRLRPEIRVVYISGYADEAIERHGALPTGDVLLEKPFTPDDLAHAVRQALRRRLA